MFDYLLKFAKSISFSPSLFAVIFSTICLIPYVGSQPAKAQVIQYCQLSLKATQEKEKLRLSALRGNKEAQNRYQKLIQQHAQELAACRSRTWPQTQAI